MFRNRICLHVFHSNNHILNQTIFHAINAPVCEKTSMVSGLYLSYVLTWNHLPFSVTGRGFFLFKNSGIVSLQQRKKGERRVDWGIRSRAGTRHWQKNYSRNSRRYLKTWRKNGESQRRAVCRQSGLI